MKTKLKRFSKRSLAMLLSILMIVSAFFVMGTVTASAAAYYVAGSFNNWSATGTEMYEIGTNSYAVIVSNDNDQQYKVTNGSWNNAWPGSNKSLSAGVRKITFNSSTKKVDDEAFNGYTIAGTDNLCTSAWAPGDPRNELTNGSITYADLPAGNYEFKVTNGSWGDSVGYSNNNVTFANGVSNNGSQNNNNIKFTTTKTDDITITYDGTNITISGKAANYNVSVNTVTGFTNGTVSVTPSSVTSGGTATFTATPSTGYYFAGWYTAANGSGSPESTDASYTKTITAATTLYAKFVSVSNADIYFKYDQTGGTTTKGLGGTKMTYDSTSGKFKYSVSLSKGSGDGNWYYIVIYDDTEGNNLSYNEGALTETLLTSSGYTLYDGDNNVNHPLHIVATKTGTYNFYFDPSTNKIYVECPHTVTFNSKGGSDVSSQVVNYGGKATAPSSNPTKTGYTFDKWVTTDGGSTAFDFSNTSITADTTVYAKWTAKQASLSFDTNGATSNGTQTVSGKATYDSAMPSFTTYTAPTKTGYSLDGWYYNLGASGEKKYYKADGTSANTWKVNTTSTTTLKAKWTEVKAGAAVKAYTDGSASGTGGKVKNGASGSAVDSFNLSSAFGISTKATVLAADPATGYTFEGWETSGAQASHIKLYKDSSCTQLYNKTNDGGTVTTIYVKTDGASGLTNANAEIHALFESAKYTVTFGGKKTDDGSTYTDLSGAVTAKYYDAATPDPDPDPDPDPEPSPEPSGGPYYLHIGKQSAFRTNTAIQFTWNGSYYYASYNVDTANADYPFVINTKNTELDDSDKSANSQAVTKRAATYNPDNIDFNWCRDYENNAYDGFGGFKIGVRNANTKIYITFTSTSAGIVYRSSVSSGSGGSGGSGGGESGGSSGTSDEGTSFNSGDSIPYGKVAKFTAEASKTVGGSTYYFTHWVDENGDELSTDNPYSITVTADKTVYARYYKVFKLSAFDSYTSDGTNVSFVTSPPKTITVKHGDETFIYNYSGTASTGNPASPDGDKVAALPIASGTYGQGNYIQYYAGDEITLHYSAMASSEIFKGVFYNNTTEFFVNKPDSSQFVAHSHPSTPAIYMNSAYYTSAELNGRTFTGVTSDNDAHSVKFTGTQDYKNIDVEIGTKRKVYFSDYTNAIIGSKNTDDYYYDGEALSVTGDQLTVKAAGNATQTNSINKDNIKFYRADANGQKTGSELSGFTVAYNSGTDPVTNSGSTASERYIIISGNMPSYDLYIDLNMTNSYTIKLGSKVMSDSLANKTRLAQVADITIKEGSTTKLTAPDDADVTSTPTSVNSGTALTLGSAFTGSWSDYYMFVGWYWGDDSAPDFQKGFISDKASLSYTPKKGGTIWAVGTRNLYINGSKYITGKDKDWNKNSAGDAWQNLRMSFDPSRGTKGSYYWEISDIMFEAADKEFKTYNEDLVTEDYGTYFESSSKYYWRNNDDKYHGKSFFQFLDEETGYEHKEIWKQVSTFVEAQDGATYGKIYPRDNDDNYGKANGQGFIDFSESRYQGYSSPIRIYLDADTKDLDVRPTSIYSNLYVSNGFDVGSTSRTSAVTVEPVVDGVVKTSGQTGYFSVGKQDNGWDSDGPEGHINHYKPQKKNATVRITKTAGGSDKIEAFFIYDITNKTVRAERDVQHSGSNYYIDLTLAGSTQNLYIVPIVEEAGANVTVSFDATQLNRKQWGDIVTAYAWYQSSGGNALGAYPGQPMIPSDDMNTWTTKFKGVKNGNELEGITFSNYVDGRHTWLGCSGVMGTVTYGGSGTSGSPTTVSIADDGLIKQYNYIESGNYKEYSRANFKAQTYDYREPIALYDRFKSADNVSISFSMKDGNSNLLSRRHSQLEAANVVTLEGAVNDSGETWSPLKWEYLTNAKGDKYIDLNGNTIKTKPTASFYICAKGQVMYDNSAMKYVFATGKQYNEVSGVTYGAASGIGMNYAVEWYVYDASGNYITNVLTAGIADLSSNGVDSYIGKLLEDKGYAVDGKSVSICYDKPRYMYGDAESGSGATGYNNKRINVGENFDAYRFTGQWNAVASNELVKVNVGVGMMTDSGEVLASSNTAAYGNATATYDNTKGNNTIVYDEDGNNAPFTAPDQSFVRTAVRDAENSPVKLNASAQNFIGWYYYDANTGDFVKVDKAGNENFYPNYSNKDVTFYAMYRASAVYKYNYTGREGARTYSASGEDLTAAEMGNGNRINPASHVENIKKNVPSGIGVFKKRIDFSPTNYDSWTKTADSKGYVLDISGFGVTDPTYTLTAYYKDTDGDHLATKTKTAVYNGSAVNLTDLNGGTPVTSYHGKPFLGWYAYDGGEVGELISTQTNYGLRLTRNQDIIAVYDENGSTTVPEDGWHVSIDENEVNKELTTSETGVYYNDTIVRVRNGSDVRATLPDGAKIGVLVVCDNKTNETINEYTPAQLTTLAGAVSSGSTKKTSKGLSITNMQATSQTSFNRTDIAVRRDYKTTLGAKYCVYAYIKNGDTYTFSAVSTVKTYE